MEQDLVSVIIPVYNSEEYLDRCVSSVVGQSYSKLEIILVDDGSTDNSPAMCDEWVRKDGRVKVIHKENAGAGYARNSGLELAKGEYICFFDSDDWVSPDAVEKAYDIARKENAQIVLFGAVVEDQKGNMLRQRIPQSQKYVYRDGEVLTDFLPDLIDGNHRDSQIHNLSLSLWVCLFSGELIQKADWKLVSEREFASEDSYSLLSLYRHVTSVAILPEALYGYREIVGSLSHAYKTDTHDRMKVFYLACIEMAGRMGYSDEIRRRIAGLFLSQEIGAMKQIVLADLGGGEKLRQIRRIVSDEITQRALAEINWQYTSCARNVLLGMMRKKLSLAVLALVKAQTMKAEFAQMLRR